MFKERIHIRDLKAITLFGLAYPIAKMVKIKNKDIWLISERYNEARDNGYWMFKYIKENKKKQKTYYVIARDSNDYKKIKSYGSVIRFGSFKHYIIYLIAEKHISAHIDSDSPNSRVSNFLETHGLLKNKRIFLQHGITKDKISFGYYNVSRADLFVCAAKPEYEFCKKEFGYPDGSVRLLGFARFDGLNKVIPKNQILIMPTWRAWLANVKDEDFMKSSYYQHYMSLLNDERLHLILEEKKINLVFFPHSDMQKYTNLFKNKSDRIIIASSKNQDVQQLLNESRLLITDYSSVAFDMGYMERPLLYYQFDYDEYRKGQHPEGYFSYSRDGFGPVVKTKNEVINWIEEQCNTDFMMKEKFLNRRNDFFMFADRNNCSRIYSAIREL